MSTPDDHITDAISQLGIAFIGSTPGPFFLELAPFSPHGPSVPPTRYDGWFLDAVMPKTPAFGARPDPDAPNWLRIIPPLGSATKTEFEQSFVLRLQASKGIDDMIGSVRIVLRNLGLTDNTYVIFTSDNGYHMGEYSLRRGKTTPFDVDIKVPFVIVGPGIAAGTSSDALTMNIDLAPTFAELAGAPPPASADGRSMVPLFTGGASTRKMAVIEHLQLPPDPLDPDASGANSGNPPSYVALRMAKALYVEYLDGTGVIGYYDMTTDPYQLRNVASRLSPAQLEKLHSAAVANYTCAGAAQCGAAQNR
jgi:arylsulfatase A-like enzyme